MKIVLSKYAILDWLAASKVSRVLIYTRAIMKLIYLLLFQKNRKRKNQKREIPN
jgi:hypothetical protein